MAPHVTDKDREAYVGDQQVPGHGTPVALSVSRGQPTEDADDTSEQDSTDDE